MQLEIEALSPVMKLIRVQTPASRVNSAFSTAYNRIAQRLSLPGFRKGRVPKSYIRKRFKQDATTEVLQTLLKEAWKQALDDHQLKPITEPHLDPSPIEPGRAYTFEFSVGCLPEIELKPYEELSLELSEWSISDEVLDHEMIHVAEQMSTFEVPEDRVEAQTGDQITLDYSGRIDGELFEGGTAEDVALVLGSGQFIPGFEEQILGHKIAEEFQVQVNFPEEYQAELLAGKEAVFDCLLKEIKSKVIPTIDETLARRMGEQDLKALREQVRDRIKTHYENQDKSAAREELKNQLKSVYNFELPSSLLETKVFEKEQMLKSTTGSEEKPSDEQIQLEAEQELRLELLFDHMAELESIEVSTQELGFFIQQMSQQMESYGASLKQIYKEPNQREALRRRMRHDKVLDFLMSKANVTRVERTVPAHVHKEQQESLNEKP